jgi:hypothetical protein
LNSLIPSSGLISSRRVGIGRAVLFSLEFDARFKLPTKRLGKKTKLKPTIEMSVTSRISAIFFIDFS